MITSMVRPYLEQLQVIDMKSYLWPWYEEGWKNIDNYNFRVMLQDNAVLGFTTFQTNDAVMLINKLCVRPKYRRLGVGTSLHKALITIARANNLLVMRSILHEENEFIGWATSWDWIAVKLERELFPDGRDGIVFEKVL